MDELIGLVPAAGKGLRLGLPYPKELYPVIRDNRYKPVAQFVLENLVSSGIGHIVFVTNETKHQLMGYFGSGSRFGCNISYVVQERSSDQETSKSTGLAHALDTAYHLTSGKTVCFGMADTIMTPKNVFSFLLEREEQDIDVIMGLYDTNHPENFGMVELDEGGTVLQIVDKPTQTELRYMWGLIVWGDVFSYHLHQCVANEPGIGFDKVMNLGISRGLKFNGVRIENGTYTDLGTYDQIVELERKHGVVRDDEILQKL